MHDKGGQPDSVIIPERVHFYNKTQGGVDALDQLCHNYTTARKKRHWPLCLFYDLLDLTVINAMILKHGSSASTQGIAKIRREFLKTLALAIVKPHIGTRLQCTTLRLNLCETFAKIINVPAPSTAVKAFEKGIGRCQFCQKSKDRYLHLAKNLFV